MQELNYLYLKNEYRLLDDGDSWGSCMNALFNIAGYLYSKTETAVPYDWHYKPGIYGPDIDDYWEEILDECHSKDILKFGQVLNRYRQMLKHAGKDY